MGTGIITCIDIAYTEIYFDPMRFEWDHLKSLANLEKHGIGFDEAQEVFSDPFHVSILDHRFSYFEERWITIGQSQGRRVLVAANMFFDEDQEEIIRIISAREATHHERKQYEDQ